MKKILTVVFILLLLFAIAIFMLKTSSWLLKGSITLAFIMAITFWCSILKEKENKID